MSQQYLHERVDEFGIRRVSSLPHVREPVSDHELVIVAHQTVTSSRRCNATNGVIKFTKYKCETIKLRFDWHVHAQPHDLAKRLSRGSCCRGLIRYTVTCTRAHFVSTTAATARATKRPHSCTLRQRISPLHHKKMKKPRRKLQLLEEQRTCSEMV